MQMTLSSFINNLNFAFDGYLIAKVTRFALYSRMECKLCEKDSMEVVFREFCEDHLVHLIRSWVCC